MKHPNALDMPHTAADDRNAVEIARIWAAHGRQHVHIRTGLWEDPAAWGIMLVDFARHIANAYEADGRGDYFDVLAKIRRCSTLSGIRQRILRRESSLASLLPITRRRNPAWCRMAGQSVGFRLSAQR